MLVGWFATVQPAAATDRDVWAELARVQQLQAQFTQTQYRAILKQPLVSEGNVAFTRAGSKLAWDVTTPSRSRFTLDGAVAKMEYPDLKVSETIDLAKVPDASRLATSLLVWMQADPAAVDRDFEATYGDGYASLRPRDEKLRALIVEIRIHFAEGPARVRAVHLVEPDGDRVEIAFRQVVLDGRPVPDAK